MARRWLFCLDIRASGRKQWILLRGDPVVIGLLKEIPFPDANPKFIRIALYQDRFTDWAQRQQTGGWWARTLVWQGPGWSAGR